MSIEVKLAEATKIEAGKKYIAVFEMSDDLDQSEIDHIRVGATAIFKELGADVKPVILIGGRMKISEIEAGK